MATRTKKSNNTDLQQQLSQVLQERDRFSLDAANYKRLYESQQGYNKKISDLLRDAERQVRALVAALADKYQPIPTEIKVDMSYRIANQEKDDQ